MIICSSSNIDLIQGVSGYGTAADGATDWRIENTATGVFNILNSPNLLTPNVSIIDAGNIGIGTIPVSGTNKLQVQGDTSVTGLITATRTTAGTNDILAMRYDSNNGIRFQQTLVAANDVRYDIIQKTNNSDYTTPAISIYKGNVGIGTNNPNAELQITCTSTATNPDTAGTIIGLYVHNPSNTATQNSVILNRIAGTTAGKVIYAFNVLNSHGCSLVMNGNDATDKLLRFNSNATATGTDLMVINNTNGNVSIGNVVTTTYKLNITGDVNVSGGYFVAGTAFKPATAGLADTATALATSRNIAGVGFNGTAAIDIPYFNLTNKITSGTGISITTGSAVASPVISTNLTAGTNVTFTGTAPNITINAAGGTSQWTGAVGANIYYNSGNVGIGTATLGTSAKFEVWGNAFISNGLWFNDGSSSLANATSAGSYSTSASTGDFVLRSATSTKLLLQSGGGASAIAITSTGNVGIGTATIQSSYKLQVQGNSWVENQLVFNDSFSGGAGGNGGAEYACNKIVFFGGGNTPTTTGMHGIGVGVGFLDYYAANTAGHRWYTGTTGGTGYGTERMRITSTGNVGIGTNNPTNILQVGGGGRLRIANSTADYTLIGCSDVDGSTNTRISLIGSTYGAGISGNINYITTSTGSHVFFTTDSVTERMRITSTGNVGIGTNNPSFRLEVGGGTTSAETMTAAYFNTVSTYYNQSTTYNTIGAKFNVAIWTTHYLTVSSDSRIKEDIRDIIDDTALQSILTIEPKTYKYIDKLQRGDKKVFGFIAQQIREVIPEAVSIQASYIPNIYLVADYIDCVITLSSQPTKVIIKMNDKIKCYDKDNKEILVEVIEVIDDLTFRIKEIEYTDTKIFVYGTFVDDFHTLDKTYIFTLNVCATQELHRRIEAQSVLLKSQNDRIKDLETKVAMLMSSM